MQENKDGIMLFHIQWISENVDKFFWFSEVKPITSRIGTCDT